MLVRHASMSVKTLDEDQRRRDRRRTSQSSNGSIESILSCLIGSTLSYVSKDGNQPLENSLGACKDRAYLLHFWGRLNQVTHEDGHKLSHAVNASSICSVSRGTVYGLALSLGLVEPFAGDRVHHV